MVKKNQLGQKIAEKYNFSKKQGMEIVEYLFEEIAQAIKGNDKVNIAGFGIFRVADRKARVGRNPKTGEAVNIPASRAPKFRASKVLKELVQ